MSKNKKQPRLGLFYKSRGKWVGPYLGYTFTQYSSQRNPTKKQINIFKRYVLKSKIKILPVSN